MNPLRGIAPACACALLLTSCSASSGGTAATQQDREGAELSVVTSIDVYADLVTGISGDTVDVEPLVTSTAADPHSYEATPQDRLKVQNADVIVANGAGYDSFITLLASSAEKEDAVYQIAEGENEHDHDDHSEDHAHHEDHDDHDHGETYDNEHLWYDLDRMEEFVLDFAEHLSEQVPAHAEQYAANAEELAEQIRTLDERAQELDAAGQSYLATEAVSGLLLDDAGLENRTEPEFLSAVEHGSDVSPRLYSRALDLAQDVDVLSYNEQTETQQSARIRTSAEDAGVAVVEFTETIPEEHPGYLDWMEANIDAIESALQEHR